MYLKTERCSVLGGQPRGKSVYSFDCTFYRLICLTAKTSHRMTMFSFLVGATEPVKRTLKRVQLRLLGLRLILIIEQMHES
jgi:anti-anti-sigma regulatory factor